MPAGPELIDPNSSVGQIVLPLGVTTIPGDIAQPGEPYATFNDEVDRLTGRAIGDVRDVFKVGSTIVAVARDYPSVSVHADPDQPGIDRGITITGIIPGDQWSDAFPGKPAYSVGLQTHEDRAMSDGEDTPPVKAVMKLSYGTYDPRYAGRIYLNPLGWYSSAMPSGNPHVREGDEPNPKLDRMFTVGTEALKALDQSMRHQPLPGIITALAGFVQSLRGDRAARV